jgi:hypothetical protein
MRDVRDAGHPRLMRIRSAALAAGWAVGLAALTVLVACYSPSPAAGLPCTSDRQCPDGQVCSPTEVCVASGSVHALDDDAGDGDFDDDGVTLENAILSRRGQVESAPWMNHGLRVVSIDRAVFGDPATVTWDELIAEKITGQGYLYSASIGWSDTGTPPGLALTAGTDVTLLLEGQIFLDTGTWKLELRADDLGFVDLAEPGSSTYRRVMTTTFSSTALGTYDAKVAGWYPVRMAMTNRNLAGNISLRGATGISVPTIFDASRLRAAVPPEARGLVMDAFDSPSLLHFRSAMVSGNILDLTYGANPPPDSGISTATAYSVRWAGQFYVERIVDGFTLTTEGGGHRVWVDGQLLGDRLAAPSATSTLVALGLTPGWHDLVIDLEKRIIGNTALRITGITGDQNAFSPENLRPVVAPAQRWLSARNTQTTSTLIPEPPAALTRLLALPSIAGTASAVNIELAVEHTAQAELSLAARSNGVSRILAAAGTLAGAGFARVRFALNPRDFGVSPGSSWLLTVADNTAMMGTGDLREVSVSVEYAATSSASLPFAPVTTFISAPRNLQDGVVAFGRMMWKLRDDNGVTVAVSVRSGATAEACLAAEWQPVDATGHTTAVPAGRFVQYRVAMTTSGLIAAALDRFTLEYYSDN